MIDVEAEVTIKITVVRTFQGHKLPHKNVLVKNTCLNILKFSNKNTNTQTARLFKQLKTWRKIALLMSLCYAFGWAQCVKEADSLWCHFFYTWNMGQVFIMKSALYQNLHNIHHE